MKWGSVSAAAKQLYAAQPNVSKALKNLEEEYRLRIFERSSTGMIPTEQGGISSSRPQRVLQRWTGWTRSAQEQQQLRRAAGGAAPCHLRLLRGGGFFGAGSPQRAAARPYPGGGSMEALDFVLRQGYHLALLRYAVEDEDYYHRYCDRHGLHREPIMEFEYRLLTNRTGPLARREVPTSPS